MESMLRAAVQGLIDASLAYVNDAYRKDVADLLDKVEARILETMRSEMEDRCVGIQEMAEVEDHAMQKISEAPLRVTPTLPDHPWY